MTLMAQQPFHMTQRYWTSDLTAEESCTVNSGEREYEMTQMFLPYYNIIEFSDIKYNSIVQGTVQHNSEIYDGDKRVNCKRSFEH